MWWLWVYDLDVIECLADGISTGGWYFDQQDGSSTSKSVWSDARAKMGHFNGFLCKWWRLLPLWVQSRVVKFFLVDVMLTWWHAIFSHLTRFVQCSSWLRQDSGSRCIYSWRASLHLWLSWIFADHRFSSSLLQDVSHPLATFCDFYWQYTYSLALKTGPPTAEATLKYVFMFGLCLWACSDDSLSLQWHASSHAQDPSGT